MTTKYEVRAATEDGAMLSFGFVSPEQAKGSFLTLTQMDIIETVQMVEITDNISTVVGTWTF